jgi:exodeoxyribonuclease VII large subunit
MLKIKVGQLNRYVRALLEEDHKLRDVYVKGEIMGFVRHRQSGHCYFKLADQDGSIKAVMFRQNAEHLGFDLEDGMSVLARASVSVFERDGVYQLYVTEMLPDGAGKAATALAQLKARLETMGVFSQEIKKPLPPFPTRVGVVTSKEGAAIHDIKTVIERRWPLSTLVLAHARVQGEGAPKSLRLALEAIDQAGCDVIILSRGGGSAEELWGFNDEALVLSLYRCSTPVICAVGHETDFTLCDFAADARAPTPSAAAELAVPDKSEFIRRLESYKRDLAAKAKNLTERNYAALSRAKTHPTLALRRNVVIKLQETLDIRRKTLYNSKRIIMQSGRRRLFEKSGMLDALSPLKVLGRGYAIARKDNKVATAAVLSAGDKLELKFADGTAQVLVLNVPEDSI